MLVVATRAGQTAEPHGGGKKDNHGADGNQGVLHNMDQQAEATHSTHTYTLAVHATVERVQMHEPVGGTVAYLGEVVYGLHEVVVDLVKGVARLQALLTGSPLLRLGSLSLLRRDAIELHTPRLQPQQSPVARKRSGWDGCWEEAGTCQHVALAGCTHTGQVQ
jgi:hypothetical protein